MLRFKLEYIFFIGGLLILAIGINMMTTITSFGLSPYDSFFIALYQNFGISIGFWIFMINFVFTLIVLFWDKKQITIGTIVTMILISLFVDWVGSITTIMDIYPLSSKIYNTYLRKSIRRSRNWSLRLY